MAKDYHEIKIEKDQPTRVIDRIQAAEKELIERGCDRKNIYVDCDTVCDLFYNSKRPRMFVCGSSSTNMQHTHGTVCPECDESKVDLKDWLETGKFKYCMFCGRKLRP